MGQLYNLILLFVRNYIKELQDYSHLYQFPVDLISYKL